MTGGGGVVSLLNSPAVTIPSGDLCLVDKLGVTSVQDSQIDRLLLRRDRCGTLQY